MLIKNNKFHSFFVSGFCCVDLIIIGSLAYFLAFEITIQSFLYYMLYILCVIILSIMIIVLHYIISKSYTNITDEKIVVMKKDKVIKEIDVKTIKSCKYESVWRQLLLNPKGGYYRVHYVVDNKEEDLFISLTKKQAQQANRILHHYS